jgi:uncharacterized protein YjbJ (UPF0337 family)
MSLDKDRVDGAVKKKVGGVKEAAGKALGDEKMKREGQTDQASGTVQNAVGGIKDAIRGKDTPRRDH